MKIEVKNIQKLRFLFQVLWLVILIFAVSVENSPAFKLPLMISMIILGVFYCGWLCAFGTIQEIVGNLGKKILKKRYNLPKNIHKFLKFSRYILIVGSLLPFIRAFDGRIIFYTEFYNLKILTITGIGVVFFYLILAFFIDRPFCNYLCPEGAKYGLICMVRFFSFRRDAEKCINCKKCDKDCSMGIEVSKKIYLRDPHCINCFKCISGCPKDGALKFEFFKNEISQEKEKR